MDSTSPKTMDVIEIIPSPTISSEIDNFIGLQSDMQSARILSFPVEILDSIADRKNSITTQQKKKSCSCFTQKYMEDSPYRSFGLIMIIITSLIIIISQMSYLSLKKAKELSNQCIIIQNDPPTCQNFDFECIDKVSLGMLQYSKEFCAHTNLCIISFIIFLLSFVLYSPPCGMKKNKEVNDDSRCYCIYRYFLRVIMLISVIFLFIFL